MTPEEFVKESGLLLGYDELRRVHDAMRAAMLRGLSHGDGCLRMIPAYVPPVSSPPPGEVIAIDAGGTNVRAAVVRFREGEEPIVEGMVRDGLPGADGEPVDGETFFARLAALVASLERPGLPLGFVFSYPTRILPDRDGILLRWTKEVRARDVEGARVGTGLSRALEEHFGVRTPSVTVLNDTVAALAAASTKLSGTGGAIGLIVGTGCNMAYFERTAAITKLSAEEAGPPEQAINMESGNFDGLPMTVFDHGLDESSEDPGRQRFEKQVAGRYLGELTRRVLRGAVGRGAVPPSVGRELAEPWRLETAHVAALLSEPARFEGPLAHVAPSEQAAVRLLARAVVTRAARLVAAGLSSVIDHLGLAAAPVAIVAEGTMYWKMPGFRQKVEETLDELTPPLGGSPRFVMLRIEDANMLGAGVAALS